MTAGTVRLVAFVLLVVGGVLALIGALRPLLRGGRFADLDLVLLLLGGAVALVGALRGQRGSAKDGGVLGLAGGVVVLLAGNDLVGALAVIGGLLYLVA
jgi:hypothetical protein